MFTETNILFQPRASAFLMPPSLGYTLPLS